MSARHGVRLTREKPRAHTDSVAHRIVEYATREQAQNAVNTLSNQTLMGRLVYVREVGHIFRSVG